eukprot:5305102-Pyramimonas_sp.AAC.1
MTLALSHKHVEVDGFAVFEQVIENTARLRFGSDSAIGAHRLSPDNIRSPPIPPGSPAPTRALLLPGKGMGATKPPPHPVPGAEHPNRPVDTGGLRE